MMVLYHAHLWYANFMHSYEKKENLEGKIFTRWTVIKDDGGSKVFCRCSCGTERWVSRSNLKQRSSVSCGCYRREFFHNKFRKVQVGQIYGRLTIKKCIGRNKSKKLIWEAECSCGNLITVTSDLLLQGSTRSCGCLRRDGNVKRCVKPMIGKTFGRLTVLEKAYTKKGRGIYYKCLCSCGNKVIVQGSMLRSGNTKSCGCYARDKAKEATFKDLTGQRFGKLTVLKPVPKKGRAHSTRYLCQCDCGGTVEVTRSSLLSGETMSCGCVQSKGEWIIANILEENNIKFEKQKTYSDLTGASKYGKLKYDFYILDGNYLLEYDGEHHYRVGGGWCNEEHVKKTQERDKLKNEYCRKNNIPLIRIPYTHQKDLCLEDLFLETTKYRVI